MPNSNAIGHKLEKAFREMAAKKVPLTPYITEHRDRYLKQMTVGGWDQLESEAEKQQALAHKAFNKVKPQQSQLVKLYDQANEFATEKLKNWVPLKSRPDWTDMKKKLLANLPPGTSNQNAEKEIKKLGSFGKKDMVGKILDPVISRSATLDETISSWQAAQLGSELALTIARFNKYEHPTLISMAKIDKWLKDTSVLLQKKEKEIWQVLKEDKLKEARDKSDKLLSWSKGAVLLKAIRTASALAVARENPLNRWKLGPSALMAADLIRNLHSAHLLGLRLAWLTRFGFGPFDQWLEAAAKLPFPSVWQTPLPILLSSLWNQMNQHDGKVVTIEGVVGPVQNNHKRNKVYSSVWLTDDKGMSMRVGILHIKIDSGGLVEGAYARITGKFAKNDNDFGTPVVRVLRRTLVEDSKHSWKDWTNRQNQYMFTPIPHTLTLSFSWERGVNGPGNLLRYGTWLPNQRRI